jgi:splicing suppressor protein 51
MSLSRLTTRAFLRVRSSPKSTVVCSVGRRHILNLFAGRSRQEQSGKDNVPILTEDNLFHPFSASPFPAIRARGETIQSLAPCPVCVSSDSPSNDQTKAPPRAVKFECPECGWPTHCSEEHWKEDEDHTKYCSRLREANEDEHDLRSGRRMIEFELPGTLFLIYCQAQHFLLTFF